MNQEFQPDESRQSRQQSWTRYWAGGALHSCLGSFSGNYEGEVLAFWREVLTGVADQGAVLDVATGNGALPRLALELAPAALYRIEAVDLAQILPSWPEGLPPAQRQRLVFQGGVAVEQLPFREAAFDRVMSQFGLEYTEVGRSLAEVMRVLRPGGLLGLVIHAEDSLIVSQAKAELGHFAWLAEQRLLGLAEELCGLMARAATAEGRATLAKDEEAIALRDAFNRALKAAEQRARQSACPDILFQTLESVMQALALCSRTGLAASGRAALKQRAELHADGRLRLHELVECARSREAVEAMIGIAGLALDSVLPLHFPNGALLGWGVRARKEA